MSTDRSDQYPDIREAVRALFAQFPGEYFRRIDEQRGYPEQFVDALTKAGWLAALIPQVQWLLVCLRWCALGRQAGGAGSRGSAPAR